MFEDEIKIKSDAWEYEKFKRFYFDNYVNKELYCIDPYYRTLLESDSYKIATILTHYMVEYSKE